MMDEPLRVELDKIHAIDYAVIEFGKNGIVEFTGDNSNGKSALSRAIKYITSGSIRDKEMRNNLIKDGCDEGKILFAKGNEALGFILRRDSIDSVCVYTPDIVAQRPEETIVRSLTDTGYQELVYKFGFRTYAKGEICLQLFPTYGSIPFVTTNGRTNNEILADITEDRVAQEFIENYEKITAPAFRSRHKTLQQQELSYQTLINSCTKYDYNEYKRLSMEIGAIVAAIGKYQYYEIAEIPIPPNVEIIDVPRYHIPEVPIVRFYPIKSRIEDGSQLIIDYENAMNNRCPTCLRLLTEVDVYAE